MHFGPAMTRQGTHAAAIHVVIVAAALVFASPLAAAGRGKQKLTTRKGFTVTMRPERPMEHEVGDVYRVQRKGDRLKVSISYKRRSRPTTETWVGHINSVEDPIIEAELDFEKGAKHTTRRAARDSLDPGAVEKVDSLTGTMAIAELRPSATGKLRLRLEVVARRRGTVSEPSLDHTFTVNRAHGELIDLVER